MPKGRTPPLWVYFCCTPAGGDDTVSRAGSCVGAWHCAGFPAGSNLAMTVLMPEGRTLPLLSTPLMHDCKDGNSSSQHCLYPQVPLRFAGAAWCPEWCEHGTGAAVGSAACQQGSPVVFVGPKLLFDGARWQVWDFCMQGLVGSAHAQVVWSLDTPGEDAGVWCAAAAAAIIAVRHMSHLSAAATTT